MPAILFERYSDKTGKKRNRMDDKELLKKRAKQNLRACQLKQLEILKVIDGICKRNDIKYWLDGGTILGAVRHGGFIPWDDDIDIAMTLEDERRFEEIAPKELPDWLFLQSPKTESDSKEPIVKVRDLNSLYIEKGDNFQAEYKKGIYVDIFPFVPYPDFNPKSLRRIMRGISKSNSILHHYHTYSLRSFAEFFWFGGKLGVSLILWKVISSLWPKHRIGNLPKQNGPGKSHLQTSVFPLGTIKFEDMEFSAPHNPDAYLTELYGDYMTIPPEEKRQVHAIYIEPEIWKNKE
jgi:lipopolysaccharide cholinephosphotransferase